MISLLAFPTETFPTLDEVEAPIRRHFEDLVEVVQDAERQSVELQIGPEIALIGPKRPAMPWGLLERPCKAAWYWPEAIPVMQNHRWHSVIVLKESRASPIEKSLLLTRLTAVLGEGLGYSGVYWDSATMVHSAESFSAAAEAMTPKDLPLRLWISFRAVENTDGTNTLFTTGLDALGQMEIEAPATRVPTAELERWAFNIAHYLLTSGERIDDGESVGRNQDEKVRVRHAPSMFDSTRPVLQLQI